MNQPASHGGLPPHVPVMREEVLQYLIWNRNGVFVDATANGGGHAESVMNELSDNGRLIGLDRDAGALARAAERLAAFGPSRVTLVHSDYAHLGEVCRQRGISAVHGVLFDLGLSTTQLDDPARGFAYSHAGPLDLRFDTSDGESAASWLRRASESDIRDVLFRFGEEPKSGPIARSIVRRRETSPIQTTAELWSLLSAVAGTRMPQLGRTAARVWQALRIHVNSELQSIPAGLNDAIELLEQHGRVVVIAYHSLEDRIVKDTFREAARQCNCLPMYPHCVCGANPRGRIITRRVLRPTSDEVAANSRARSARMRVFEKDVLKSGRGAA